MRARARAARWRPADLIAIDLEHAAHHYAVAIDERVCSIAIEIVARLDPVRERRHHGVAVGTFYRVCVID